MYRVFGDTTVLWRSGVVRVLDRLVTAAAAAAACGAGAPAPCTTHRAGKTSAHTMHQQPGQLDAGREAHSLACMPVPLIDTDRTASVVMQSIHSTVHSSHQQSSAIIIYHVCGQRQCLLMSCACIACEAWPQSVAPYPGSTVRDVLRVSRGARQPALRGKPRSVLD